MTAVLHKTVTLQVGNELVEVDEDIAPVVRWLNSFPDFQTEYSCQGDDRDEGAVVQSKPYILFHATSFESLIPLLEYINGDFTTIGDGEKVQISPGVTLEVDYYQGEVRYVLRWYNSFTLLCFIERLKVDYPEVVS